MHGKILAKTEQIQNLFRNNKTISFKSKKKIMGFCDSILGKFFIFIKMELGSNVP